MSKAKHTPGKWLLRDTRDKYGRGSINIELEPGGVWIASVEGTHVGPKDRQECMANAILIAAAPELLEALMTSLPYMKHFIKNEDFYVIEKIEAAIAKATGQTEKLPQQ